MRSEKAKPFGFPVVVFERAIGPKIVVVRAVTEITKDLSVLSVPIKNELGQGGHHWRAVLNNRTWQQSCECASPV
jgi:hypothetical protein